MAVVPSENRSGLIQQMLGPLIKQSPPPAQPAMGFFTDTSLCIGCKACEVACKQWNQLPAQEPIWTGSSYDNTGALSPITWRHVQFIEQIGQRRSSPPTQPELPSYGTDDPRGRPGAPSAHPDAEHLHEPLSDHTPSYSTGDPSARAHPDTPDPRGRPEMLPFFNTDRWLMRSDVCKHCANAPCQEACPTGAIIRTEFDTVYVQQDICNGCGYCVVACPFGVIARDGAGMHTARKCTLCYDRMKDGLEPACAKACPTDSIVFGDVQQLKAQARERLGLLQERGVSEARLYGVDDEILDSGLNSFFLLLDEPAVYNLPENPPRPANHVAPASFWSIFAALLLGLLSILFFRE